MMNSVAWNPWHGCHKISEGCRNCYVYYLDKKRGLQPDVVTKNTTTFDLPVKKDRYGSYKIPSGTEVMTCFTSDFFIEEADLWRIKAWEMIKTRNDLSFLIPTKSVHRVREVLPADWEDGYENVTIAVSAENQKQADARLPVFLELPVRHRMVFASPLLEYVDLSEYLETGEIDAVSASGESYDDARICDFDWVRKIKHDCDMYDVPFMFHQTGSNLLVDGRLYHIPHQREYEQAEKAMKYM